MKSNAVKPSHNRSPRPFPGSSKQTTVSCGLVYTLHPVRGGRLRATCEYQKQKRNPLTSGSHSQSCTDCAQHAGTGRTQRPAGRRVYSGCHGHSSACRRHSSRCLMCLCSRYQQALGCKDQIGSDFTVFKEKRSHPFDCYLLAKQSLLQRSRVPLKLNYSRDGERMPGRTHYCSRKKDFTFSFLFQKAILAHGG